MTNWDSQTFTNISADTEVFNLAGGKYGMSVVATWKSGSVTMQILAADESTWLAVAIPFTADGFQTADLPPGQYRFQVTNATAAYVTINGIPYD
jgi:predicted phage tail protein